MGILRVAGPQHCGLDVRKTAALALVALVPERTLAWRPAGTAGAECAQKKPDPIGGQAFLLV